MSYVYFYTQLHGFDNDFNYYFIYLDERIMEPLVVKS